VLGEASTYVDWWMAAVADGRPLPDGCAGN
jgi:hypothetical protein